MNKLSHNEILDTSSSLESFDKLTKKLGYDSFYHFFSDNPGAIQQMIKFVSDNYADESAVEQDVDPE